MTRLALLALCACAPSAAVTVDATDAPASNPTSDEPALTDCPEPEPPACIPLPIYCGGYAVELCDDERGHAVYVPAATPSAFWCHDGDCSLGLTTLMQWCAEGSYEG